MSPRDIPQLRPFFLLLSLSLLSSIIIRRFIVFIKNCRKKPSSGGLVVFLNDNTDNGDNTKSCFFCLGATPCRRHITTVMNQSRNTFMYLS